MNDVLKKRLATAGIAAAFPIIAMYEGMSTKAYLDPISIPTICRGHTGGVKMGDIATVQECDELTVRDLLDAKSAMESCTHVPMNDYQRAAFVSFVFNVGPGRAGVKDGFCMLKSGRPSTMVTKLNKGDYIGACNEINRQWAKAGGVELPGLVKRRNDERKICLTQ
ncbi:lysozyme [Undibacterium aquatile]|uniref:Lysozyme n=1 Tax=Undibacterium aquatile TaxID=1537398 RepID=A0ABR6XF08_9BURK|nr:lysozyme [Undibacterium aquatile]MBC3811318.1 lysozyme [Undibacterium aquatile]